jgi:hypothetical protein
VRTLAISGPSWAGHNDKDQEHRMSDDTTPQDSAAMPPASAGSHGEPVGWQATDEFGRPSGFLSWKDDENRWPKNESVPLYLQPKPTLTDAERKAVDTAEASLMRESTNMNVPQPVRKRLGAAAATLRGLLERLSPPAT